MQVAHPTTRGWGEEEEEENVAARGCRPGLRHPLLFGHRRCVKSRGKSRPHSSELYFSTPSRDLKKFNHPLTSNSYPTGIFHTQEPCRSATDAPVDGKN